MGSGSKEKRMAVLLENMLEPLYSRLEEIDSKIGQQGGVSQPKYYRNEDLKKIFGLSSNTIVKYRQQGLLPFTKLGEIFLYEASKIEKLLKDRADGKM